jgi:hypothetical protein
MADRGKVAMRKLLETFGNSPRKVSRKTRREGGERGRKLGNSLPIGRVSSFFLPPLRAFACGPCSFLGQEGHEEKSYDSAAAECFPSWPADSRLAALLSPGAGGLQSPTRNPTRSPTR